MVVVMIPMIAVMVFVPVHHVLEVPMGLLVVMMHRIVVTRGTLFVFVHESAVADVFAALAFFATVAIAMPEPVAVPAIAFAGLANVAIVLAVPSLQPALMIAPPLAVAAIADAAPPAEIAFAAARVWAVAIVVAAPTVPIAIVSATPALATIAITVAITFPAAAMVELNGRHGIERIEHDGVQHRYARIFIRTAGLAGEDMAGGRQTQDHHQSADHQTPRAATSARRHCACHIGDLLQ